MVFPFCPWEQFTPCICPGNNLHLISNHFFATSSTLLSLVFRVPNQRFKFQLPSCLCIDQSPVSIFVMQAKSSYSSGTHSCVQGHINDTTILLVIQSWKQHCPQLFTLLLLLCLRNYNSCSIYLLFFYYQNFTAFPPSQWLPGFKSCCLSRGLLL